MTYSPRLYPHVRHSVYLSATESRLHGLARIIYDSVDTTNVEDTARRVSFRHQGAPEVSQGQLVHRKSALNIDNDVRIAHNIVARFKREERSSGKLGEDLNEVVNLYMHTVIDDELSREQKVMYCQNLLEGEALSFYSRQVEPNAQEKHMI